LIKHRRGILNYYKDRISTGQLEGINNKIKVMKRNFKEVQGASFKSWSYRILMNTAISYYRKRSREYDRLAPIDVEHYESLGSEDERFRQQELSDLVASMLTKLPKALSRVVTLRFLEGKTYDEIAELEDTTPGAIKTRVYRAKQELNKLSTL